MAADPGARLTQILERNRARTAPDLPSDLLAEMAEIEEQNQFDDDRRDARQALREAVANALRKADIGATEQ